MTPDLRAQGRWEVAIDRGGTFTDIVARDPQGRLHVHKVLSQDPRHADDPGVRGIEELLARCGQPDGRGCLAAVRLGTTVATNALLERKGEPTLLVTTRGFRDALRIGYQERPEIFARAIQRPEVLYQEVIEAEERIDTRGHVVHALDEARLRVELVAARQRGLDAVAIVFLHGFRHPRHEARAAAIARELGFREVVASHEAAPLLGFVARGDTAVADAYLSPVLLRSVRRFNHELSARFGPTPLLLMQSNGGLVDLDGLRGVNGVLSGPAGGVVGMIAAGTAEGRVRLLGFDMGGTSTDVSLYAGELPRRYATEIDGVRLQVPTMDIETIAAGGGSIVRFADGRLQVGPDSAGADPGPACYRRNGPATLTDCNVVLGRIAAERFPRVFGPDGRAPIDVQAARARLTEIADAASAAGTPYSCESLAEAFVSVAVARMANAVRELALHHGLAPAQFPLVSFGGAAGQHACAVAEALGLSSVLLHPLAGVLSAHGIALAGRRSIRRRSLGQSLDEAGFAAATAVLETLSGAARAELERQGVAGGAVGVRCIAQLRLLGSDTPLDVDWQSLQGLREAFGTAHERVYGFVPQAPSIFIAALTAEAFEHDTPGGAPAEATGNREAAEPPATVSVWVDGGGRSVALLDRAELEPGRSLTGPALVSEAGATSWIAPGWTGRLSGRGALLLERTVDVSRAAARTAAAAAPDPMRLEVFNGLFMHVAEQMGEVLRQTASSVNIKERLDFSCALFDGAANLVANAPHMPVHLGSMGASVTAVLDAHGHDLQPGDAFLVNSPYDGGTHLPDMTVVSPVFDACGARIDFFTASRAHHADVGGITPGSMPPASRDIGEEGALIPATRIVRAGRFDEPNVLALLTASPWPARNTAQNLADLRAQLAANARGTRELHRAAAERGHATLLAYMGFVQDNAEQCMRRAIRRLRDGQFRYEMDDGQLIAVTIRVHHDEGTATIDFTGTSAQRANNFNAPRAVTVAAVLYVFRTLIEEPIPLNAGCLRPLSIVVPSGSMLDPRYPAAVVAGNVETSQCIVDALYGALGLQAAAQGTMNNLTFGNDRYQYYETIAGGAGAGPGYAGASGVQTHMTNSRLTDPEVLEERFPVRLQEFALRGGSGGGGAWRGGDGLVRRLQFLEPMTVAILSNHRRIAPFGLAGGGPGRTGVNRVLYRDGRLEVLAATAEFLAQPGDQVEIATPGGGGFGVERGEVV
ncbi:MAG TPA: hydantoinase B/oxoprolinase family protein [Steroidobacteraceae bacterium]|nr:hydantoinase B/oxoprolinase family protein [Steroidobacteraceae bacterium]